MNNLRKYITPFILVFALFAINGSEFLHHHDADASHHDDKCQACIFNNSLNSTLVEQVFIFSPQLFSYHLLSNSVNPIPQTDWFITSPGRAPPVVSHI